MVTCDPRPGIAILTDVYFCRLKLNHDSHEFILEFGTVANNGEHVGVSNQRNQIESTLSQNEKKKVGSISLIFSGILVYFFNIIITVFITISTAVSS
jgi:hypothetical protein